VERSTTRDAASCVATGEFRSISYKPTVHYRIHEASPIVPILSQTDPLHTVAFYLYKINLNAIHPLTSFPSFPLTFLPVNNRRSFSLHSGYMSRPPHPSLLDNSNYTWRRVQITQLFVMQFSLPSRHFIPLWSKYPPQHPVLKHPQP
jgi:hypothetical protein